MNRKLYSLNYLQNYLSQHQLNSLEEELLNACQKKISKPHGDVAKWQKALTELPKVNHHEFIIKDDIPTLKTKEKLDSSELHNTLMQFYPWRKGPFNYFNELVDCEWKSYLKWQRLINLGIDFKNKKVIDIGCGNGYFLWLIANQKANSVIGVDPMWLFFHQFMTLQTYVKDSRLLYLPLGIEDIPQKNNFDIALSMGVLYHRRSPLDHLLELKGLIKKDGLVVIETIVLTNQEKTVLTPIDRYAGMRNVWMIPSVGVLTDWLKKVNLEPIKASACIQTTTNEQRQTKWMMFHSLNQFLNKERNNNTIEGYEAPHRVIIIARAS